MGESRPADVAVLGGGCFWCTEAVFEHLRGVQDVACGYCGGSAPQPTYEQVCGEGTGHAECVRISFDPDTISFSDLLEVFFQTHDPTTLNRQGHDAGTQYRSVIFCQDERQRKEAEETIDRLERAGAFASPIVTQLVPAQTFFPAEAYHQGYFRTHPSQPYCMSVIRPKVDKFRVQYRDLL